MALKNDQHVHDVSFRSSLFYKLLHSNHIFFVVLLFALIAFVGMLPSLPKREKYTQTDPEFHPYILKAVRYLILLRSVHRM